MTTHPHPAILVIAPAWVGDMVMAQSLFKVLRRQQPTVAIDVVAPAWSAELLKRMPEVRHIIQHNIQHGELAWRARRDIGCILRRTVYQQAIVLPNSWKSALIPFWANIPHRTGYTGELRYGLLNDRRTLDKVRLYRTVDQFIALGLSPNDARSGQWVPKPRLSPGNPEPVLARLHLDLPVTQPVLMLCPGAEYGEAKRWPAEYYAVVAKRQVAAGWQVWLLGSDKDAVVAAHINALSGDRCVNLTGMTRLAEVVDLMALASAVISNDSGLMHIAAALHKPLIAVYGSSDPIKTPPLHAEARILTLNLACSPCFQRTCPLKHLNCLRDLKPQQVLETLASFNL